MSLVGAPIARIDGPAKVTGQARYTADVELPRLAHAVMVLSTIARGRIAGIDSERASRMPGVITILSHLDAPRLPDGGRAGINPPAGRVLSLFQDDEVHYDREPVALVVAETLDEAIAAAAAVVVRYRREDARLDFSAAAADAHTPEKVNTEPADSARGTFARTAAGQESPDPAGNGTGGSAVTATYTTPMEHHNPLEPHATVALWQGERLTLYDATQYISGCRTTLAKTLGIPEQNVRVVCPFVGGGFGCKGSAWSHVALAAMAARRTGRPVKLVLERPQMYGPVGGRPRTRQQLAVRADGGGRFSSLRHDVLSHTSAIEDFTEPSALQTRMLYACENVATTHRLVRLDVGTPTFQRAPGEATGTFALESALDELALALGRDPIELRLQNEPARDPDKDLPWSSRLLAQCFQSGAAAFDWAARTPQPQSMRAGRELVGWGVATATYPANRSAASAVAKLTADGTVLVQCGTQDLGTGTYTIIAQVAADALGFPVDRIRVELGDSQFPAAPVSGGSQSAASVCPAVQSAAQALRRTLIALAVADEASPVFKAPPDEIVVEGGAVGLRAAGRREPLAATLMRRGGGEIAARGDARPGEEHSRHSFHSFGAVFVEVRIDPELRVIRVPRVVARYDIGRLLNATTGRSQLLGGIVWGLGMALMEETILDERYGRIVNANLADYHVPTNADIGIVDVEVLGVPDPFLDPQGARGIGEIGITGVAAALANAVHHATGVRVRRLPITLDTLLV